MTQATGTRLSAATFVRRLGGSGAADAPGYRELAHRIRGAVLDGRLPLHTGLPSERDLAGGLSVSRTTVAAAYGLLREEGWLDSRRGSGSRLRLPDDLAPGTDGTRRAARTTQSMGPAGVFGYHAAGVEPLIDLSTASLPAAEGPVMAALETATELLPGYLASDGYLPFGLPALRAVIAERFTADGIPTAAEQILVTSGAQHAFTLALQELSSPGDRVMLECPTYPLALDAIRSARRIPGPVGLSMSENPWDAELFASTMRQTAPRLGYLIPDFQNPTGALMDLRTRESLLAAARGAGTELLIDESFRDVPFTSTGPLPPRMAALTARSDESRVITLGSVSKSLWGGLRIGWIRASRPTIDRLAAARAQRDMSGPVLEQLIAMALLAEPTAALALQRERLTLGAGALATALARHAPGWRSSTPLGGGSAWVRLPGPYGSELARLAPTAGISIAPGPRFGPDGTMESYLRFPFTQPPGLLDTAVQRLATLEPQAAAARGSAMPGWLA